MRDKPNSEYRVLEKVGTHWVVLLKGQSAAGQGLCVRYCADRCGQAQMPTIQYYRSEIVLD